MPAVSQVVEGRAASLRSSGVGGLVMEGRLWRAWADPEPAGAGEVAQTGARTQTAGSPGAVPPGASGQV